MTNDGLKNWSVEFVYQRRGETITDQVVVREKNRKTGRRGSV